MHFYKTKFDAASPMRQQLNIPTNTDYMVGTELYVKGEKKEITAENVKISPSPKQYVDEVITLKYGADTEWGTWNGTTHQWTILKPFTIKPHYYVDSGTVVENKDHTAISYGTWYDTTGPAMITVNSIRSSTGSVVANIKRYRTSDVQTYGLKPEYYCVQTTAYVSEFAVEAGMTIRAFFDDVSWQTSDLVFTNKVETGILAPDTEVNGIPAFTMKSLDAEADKLYDVEFKKEVVIDEGSALSGANTPEFTFLSANGNTLTWRLEEDWTIKSNLKRDASGENWDIVDGNTTQFVMKLASGNEVHNSTIAIFALHFFENESAAQSTHSIALQGKSRINNYQDGTTECVLLDSDGAVAEYTFPAGTIVRNNGNMGIAYPANFSYSTYIVTPEEAYDCKFKLFINEDEQAYGDVQVGQEFENTITLSGTYEDDTTFSYTIPVVED